MFKVLMSFARSVRNLYRTRNDRFLREARGVVHVGANSGQERFQYQKHGLRVAWIEPIPEVFQELEKNIQGFENQYAYRYLVSDKDDQEYEFHVANNGVSSSILPLKLHKDIWPEVTYAKSIPLKSITLATLVEVESIDLTLYDTLIMDTQGSELLVLKGAIPLLDKFRFVKAEVADFESYAGCCQLSDIIPFMAEHGFRERARSRLARHPSGGCCYDVIFQRST